MWVCDTNLYVRALRDPSFAAEFKAFEQAALSELWVSAVVAFEIEAGAKSQREASAYERWMLRQFAARRRVLVPSASTWRLVARADRALRTLRTPETKLAQRSFLDDMLIAASCREVGATLVTANRADFELIRRVLGFRFVSEFPTL